MKKSFSKIIIIGHTGFIGSCIFKKIKENKIHDHVFGFSTSDFDLRKKEDALKLSHLFDEDTLLIVCAGIKKNIGESLNIFSQNIDIIKNIIYMLENTRIKKLIYFSSTSVYSEKLSDNISEESTVSPSSYYGIAKFTSELLLQKFLEKKKIPLVVLRPSIVYGIGDEKEAFRPFGLCGIAKEKGEVTLYGDGKELRDFIFVEDVADLTIDIARTACVGVYNLASGKAYSFFDIVELISIALNKKIKIVSLDRTKQKSDQKIMNDKISLLFPNFCFNSLDGFIRKICIDGF